MLITPVPQEGGKNCTTKKYLSLFFKLVNWSTLLSSFSHSSCEEGMLQRPQKQNIWYGIPDPVWVILTSCHIPDVQEKCHYGWRCRNSDRSPQRSHRRFTDLALLISHKSLLRLRPRPRLSPSPDGWVSLIKDLEFTTDKKFGQLLLRYSTWHCRATPSSPQFHPSDLLVHSLTPADTSAEQATWAELRGQKALDRRNSFYTAPYVSKSPKEKQASSLTKNTLPELLHFEFAVPQRLCMPKSALFFFLFFKPKILSLMDLVCPYDLQSVADLQKQPFNSGFVRV